MTRSRLGAVAAVAALVLVASVAGCGGRGAPPVDGGGVAAPGPSGNPDDALAAWKDFPVDRHPRPIVLVGPVLVRFAGYTTDNAKIAAMSGSYRLDAALPPDPPASAVTLPDGPATVPVIGAAAAIDRMKAAAGGGVNGATPPTLRIIAVELGTADFPTDRGALTLPAWRVHTAEEVGPTVVLAVADSALARQAGAGPSAGALDPGSSSAKASADGRRFTLTTQEVVPHCPGEPIYSRTAGVRETRSAVVVTFTATRTGTVPGDPGGACADYLKLQPATYQVELAAPLGNRVLVDTGANPVPVTTG
jgi:hypothetical protein